MKTEIDRSVPSTLLILVAVISMAATLLVTSSCNGPVGRRAFAGGAGGAIAGGILGGGRGAVAGAVIGGTLGALSAPPAYGFYPPPRPYYGYRY